MKFCHKCGAQCEDGAKFCKQCGAALADVNAESKPADIRSTTTGSVYKCRYE